MQQITNGQRPATKQRNTDRIISIQTQTNVRNLKISNPYTKATQNNKQNKDKYGQSIQHNTKTNAKQIENQNKHKQTHKSPTTIKLSRELQNNTQSWDITPPALGSLLDQLAGPARPGRQRISPAGGSAKKGDPPRGSRRQLGLITHAFISTVQAMFKKSSPGKGFRARSILNIARQRGAPGSKSVLWEPGRLENYDFHDFSDFD